MKRSNHLKICTIWKSGFQGRSGCFRDLRSKKGLNLHINLRFTIDTLGLIGDAAAQRKPGFLILIPPERVEKYREFTQNILLRKFFSNTENFESLKLRDVYVTRLHCICYSSLEWISPPAGWWWWNMLYLCKKSTGKTMEKCFTKLPCSLSRFPDRGPKNHFPPLLFWYFNSTPRKPTFAILVTDHSQLATPLIKFALLSCRQIKSLTINTY